LITFSKPKLILAMKYIFSLIILLLCFTSCEKDEIDSQKKEALKTYSEIVLATYTDSYDKVKELQLKINDFVATPTQSKFEACKAAWKEARIPYGQTEGFRFYGGPIDSEEGPEGLINGWPMDESYVDYVQGKSEAGIINNVIKYPSITKDILEKANENGAETNISTGFHAIEFLLWGQDLYANSAGQRPYTDYLTTGGTAKNQTRRAQYLKIVTELLVENLESVKAEWESNGTYRKEFLKMDTDKTIGMVLRGIATLSKGELAGERMTVALTNRDQEDEHSCFSDNTHVDIYMNFKSIQNVYLGKYTRSNGTVISGVSMSDVINSHVMAAEKNKIVLASLIDADTKTKAILDAAPFDKLILSDPQNKVTSSINILRKLSDQMVDAAFAMGIVVDNELD
jgi:putative iron-regulated protein